MGTLYMASKQINYSWQWARVLPYIVNTAPLDLRASGNGTITEVTQKTITLTLDDGGKTQVFKTFDQAVAAQGDLIFEGDVVARSVDWRAGPLLNGLWVTLKISVISLFFATLLGLIAGLMRISTNPACQNLAFVYIGLIRGTPLLVQIFIMYFFVGTMLNLDRFSAGVMALSIFTGAYIAEIVRSGIQSISPGQMEAARSLGMSYPKAMTHVILPQAFKRTLPPMAGQLINLIKDSSLVSVIAITDLTKAGREAISGSFATFEVWITVAGLYLILTTLLSWVIRRIEKRLAASD
ncbi:ABC transporter permease subunit [uncultured Pseudomonas sp.]|uniref:ABC transporter permease subunit n=1 Tax=uncultured Pseudomonas sp. TaxID=114707 RepID=UPI0026039913|nr:ABC transporter permease subunit [uncultured Pseudomonas sp.]